MNVIARALLATAWIVAAPAAWAQDAAAPAPAAPAAPGGGCNAVCQLFKGLSGDRNPAGSAPAAAPAAAPVAAAQAPQPAETKRRHARRAPAPHPSRAAAAASEETAAIREPSAKPTESAVDRGSPGSIKVLTGPDAGLQPTLADLGAVLAPQFKLEAVRGKNAPLKDLLTLPGVDMAVVSAPTLAKAGAASSKLVYVAKLFGEELHLLAGPDVKSIEDLAGKPVDLGPAGGDTETVARAAFADRGVQVASATPAAGFDEAVAALRRGDVAAVAILAPKPYAPLADAAREGGLHLVSVPFGKLDESFDPGAFTSADYPGLVPEGQRIETVAADAILVAPWWRDSSPRQRELTAAATAIFERFPDLLKEGRHPKWKETNLAAVVDGKRRLKSADQWVHAQMKSRRPGEHAASSGQ